MQRWHLAETEKAEKAKKAKEEAEAELRHQMRDRLMAAGVPEPQLQAMLDGKRVMPPQIMHPRPMMQQHHVPPPPPMHHQNHGQIIVESSKTTYTRMARKHLSIEALRARAIEWELDQVSSSLFLSLSHTQEAPPLPSPSSNPRLASLHFPVR